jgi:Protein of unknown function (DUF1279)
MTQNGFTSSVLSAFVPAATSLRATALLPATSSLPCCPASSPHLSPPGRTRAPAVIRAAALDEREKEPKTEAGGQEARPTSAKELATRYGGAYLGTSIALSLVSFGALYAMIAVGVDVRSGIVGLGDWLATTPVGRPKALDSISESTGTFALAYIAHKASSPLRFPPTLVATEFVARKIAGARKNVAENMDVE